MLNTLPTADLRRVRVGDVDVAYQVFGDEDGHKRPLVMMHGYSIRSTGEMYRKLYDALAAEFVVYAFDQRGHGGSAGLTQEWTFAQVAHDVAGAVQALGLRNPVHAGHSWGGFMGLMIELLHPGTFSALCLLAASAASGGVATPEEVKSTITNEGRNRPVIGGLISQMYVRPVSSEHLGLLVDAIGLVEPDVHRTYFYQEYPAVVITDRLGSITAPVLNIIGAQDNVVAPDEQHLTARGLPNGKEVIFNDEGHMLPLEAAERTAREMINFYRYDL